MDTLEQALAASALQELQTSEAEAWQRFQLSPDFVGFSGHFPGNPLLPAFVQTLMGRLVLQQWLGQPRKVLEVDRAKFKLPVGPGMVEVRCKQLDQGHLVQLETEKGLASSFLLFSEPFHEAGGPASRGALA